jgi:hypothetical protein
MIPEAKRLLTNSAFDDPEQYQAIEENVFLIKRFVAAVVAEDGPRKNDWYVNSARAAQAEMQILRSDTLERSYLSHGFPFAELIQGVKGPHNHKTLFQHNGMQSKRVQFQRRGTPE